MSCDSVIFTELTDEETSMKVAVSVHVHSDMTATLVFDEMPHCPSNEFAAQQTNHTTSNLESDLDTNHSPQLFDEMSHSYYSKVVDNVQSNSQIIALEIVFDFAAADGTSTDSNQVLLNILSKIHPTNSVEFPPHFSENIVMTDENTKARPLRTRCLMICRTVSLPLSFSCAQFKSEDEDMKVVHLRKHSLLVEKSKIIKAYHILKIRFGQGSLAMEDDEQSGYQIIDINLTEQQLKFWDLGDYFHVAK